MLRLVLPGRMQVLQTTNELVGRLTRVAGFGEDSRRDVEVAVHEALVNAMVHGNAGDEDRHVFFRVVRHPHGLEFRVRDEGQGFDPTRVPDPLAPENLVRPSGRGILLMTRLMDEVAFRQVPGGGTEVAMLKRFASRLESRAACPDEDDATDAA